MEIIIETLGGDRIYVSERDTVVIDDEVFTCNDILSLMSNGTLSSYGLKGASPVKSEGRTTKASHTRLPLLAATFMKG